MGRDYIGERMIADPRERAVERCRERARQPPQAHRATPARNRETARWCIVPGGGHPRAGGNAGFWPYCAQAGMQRWRTALGRREEEVAQAYRQGIPAARPHAARQAAAQ